MTQDTVTVLLIGLDEGLSEELVQRGGVHRRARRRPRPTSRQPRPPTPWSWPSTATAPLEALGRAPDPAPRRRRPRRDPARARHRRHGGPARRRRGRLVDGSIPPGLLPRAVRYAVARRRLHRELATQDEATGLPNLRGFAPSRSITSGWRTARRRPVVFLFVRLDGYQERGSRPSGPSRRTSWRATPPRCCWRPCATPTSRPGSPPTRSACCSPATPSAPRRIVLSRLVEAIAVHDARRDRPRELSISVGSALYDPAAAHHAGADPRTRRAPSHGRGQLGSPGSRSVIRPTMSCEYLWRNARSTRGAPARAATEANRSEPMGMVDVSEAHDRELVRRLRHGDEDAFRGLFGRYAPSANALALRVVRQSHLAEEIVQEAFLAVWRNPDGYDAERGSVRSWLMGMVHHRAVDLVRREEAYRRRAEDSIPAGASSEQADHADEVVEALGLPRSAAIVRAALDELPAEQRDVLTLDVLRRALAVADRREDGAAARHREVADVAGDAPAPRSARGDRTLSDARPLHDRGAPRRAGARRARRRGRAAP